MKLQLSVRKEAGEEITEEKLHIIDQAEQFLIEQGYRLGSMNATIK